MSLQGRLPRCDLPTWEEAKGNVRANFNYLWQKFLDFESSQTSTIPVTSPGKPPSIPSDAGGGTLAVSQHSSVCIPVFDSDVIASTGDGKAMLVIPENLSGKSLVAAVVAVITMGTGSAMNIQIRRFRAGLYQDMLSAPLVIGSAYYSTFCTPDPLNNGVLTGDALFIDVDSVHLNPAYGVSVTLTLF